jgi:hypothetical protein
VATLPPDFEATRLALHAVAAHVLGRRRFEVSGRFGLRATPGGFGTPAFGDGPETVRVAGGFLVRETAGEAAYRAIAGSSLRALATFAGTDVDREFSVGADTPAVDDFDAPLAVGAASAGVVAEWLALGWRALDEVVGGLDAGAAPATVQLWPEHFDAGTNVGLATGSRVNLGASPGDASLAVPYLYVGPRGSERPGDPAYWNAPFGATLAWADVVDQPDPAGRATAFLRTGLGLLQS